VTAASLFDGHDASINIMRRILQRHGAEVIHLGHNRSVDEVVTAAIQEDVQGVAVSSYQGGHVEYFTYLVELLRERGPGTCGSTAAAGCDRPGGDRAVAGARGRADLLLPKTASASGCPG
jgi:methylmalonyl-CoA mutase